MKNFFSISFILLIFISAITLQAQVTGSQTMEIDENLYNGFRLEFPHTEALWDVQFNYDASAVTGAAGNAGAVFIPTLNEFWTSRWASNVLHRWTASGTLIEQFTIAGVTGIRSMTFDGTYVYAGTATTTIRKIDPVTRTLVSSITAPGNARYCTYDPTADGGNGGLWFGDWSTDLRLISLTGTLLVTHPYGALGVTSIYGAAWENFSTGGPFLWLWGQGAGAGAPQWIVQINPATGLPTGITHNVLTDIGVGNPDAIAGGLFAYDGIVPGFATLGGLLQGVPDRLFGYELAPTGPVPGPGPATDPNPANGATGVSAPDVTLSWTNPAGATSNEVWFGTAPGTLAQIHSGSLISTIPVTGLAYSTTYYWRVNEIDATGTTPGPLWSFTTMQDPDMVIWCEPFQDLSFWTILGPLGLTNWNANNSANAGGTAPELRLTWTPSFNGESRLRSNVIPYTPPLPNNMQVNYSFKFYLNWYANPSGTFEVLITWDGGTTTSPIYSLVDPTGHVGPLTVTGSFMSPASGPVNLQVEIVYTGNSFNINQAYWDDLCFWWIIPVELTSFTADTRNNDIMLNWTTASEMNNQGFEIEKSINGVFQKIGYVAGHGTTTETQNYSYLDKNVGNGTHTYRLKQVDFDGTFTYSQEVFVDIAAPAFYTLEQNYPNPFNPSTKIEFGLAVDSKVNVKVFDILGQQVANLADANMAAGFHSVDFDASNLNSGVYFYSIEAAGVDGQKFSQTKKMMFMK